MGYRLNRLDEPVFMAVLKLLPTEFGIHHRLESCDVIQTMGSGINADNGQELKSDLLKVGYYAAIWPKD